MLHRYDIGEVSAGDMMDGTFSGSPKAIRVVSESKYLLYNERIMTIQGLLCIY
jgi:hypothetical protein